MSIKFSFWQREILDRERWKKHFRIVDNRFHVVVNEIEEQKALQEERADNEVRRNGARAPTPDQLSPAHEPKPEIERSVDGGASDGVGCQALHGI